MPISPLATNRTNPRKFNTLRLKNITPLQFSAANDNQNKPPKSKLPSWVKTILLSGAGLIGLGQLPPLEIQTQNTTNSKPFKSTEVLESRLSTSDGFIIRMKIERPDKSKLVTLSHFNKNGISNVHLIHLDELRTVLDAFENIYAQHTWQNLYDMTQADFDDALRCELIAINCKKEAVEYEKRQQRSP
jgi:hypothetical protein